MGTHAVSCLNISFAESSIVPYVSKFLSSESKSPHKTSIKYLFLLLFLFCGQVIYGRPGE